MREVQVRLAAADYGILVGAGLLDADVGRSALAPVVTGQRCAVVTDGNVGSVYGDQLCRTVLHAGAAACVQTEFPAGEASKTLATLENLYRFAVANRLDRSSVVLALGGGVVGDVAGFLAATFLRGIALVQVPTSLLALVDSSVGGKVAVDLPEGKNLVGAFYQPRLVLGDLSCLQTLPAREFRCGMAEVVKYGVILSVDLFGLLEKEAERVSALDPDLLGEVVARCCSLKARVVEADEREAGERAILNYGHTFGHALELLGGFQRLNHGEAVAVGMGMAADLAVAIGLAAPELRERQDALLQRYALPLQAADFTAADAPIVLSHMYRDKKVRAGKLRLVLPREPGTVVVREFADDDLLKDVIGGRLG